MIYAEQNKNRGSFTSVAKRYAYFWEIHAYLQRRFEITPVDAILPSVTLYALSKKLTLQGYDSVIMCVRSNNIERSLEYARFFKVCRPDIKIIVYGDIVSLLPRFFMQYDCIDAVVTGGDYEISISSYLNYIEDGISQKLVGVYVQELKKNFAGSSIGDEWLFTDLDVAPHDVYSKMVIDKREMTITVQRGCPHDCSYCLATKMFSSMSRMKDPQDIIGYCMKHRSKFDTYRFFAPVFTIDREWAKDLCRQMIAAKTDFKWCTTTRYELLDDEELVDLMVNAGCYKVSVGVETLGDSAITIGRRNKLDVLGRVAGYVNKYPHDYDTQTGMIVCGLCMLGVPGQSKQDVIDMFSLMEELKIRIRPTSYSPLEELALKSDLTVVEIEKYDKFTYYDGGIENVSANDYFRLLFNPHLYREIFQVGDSSFIESGFRQCDRFIDGKL